MLLSLTCFLSSNSLHSHHLFFNKTSCRSSNPSYAKRENAGHKNPKTQASIFPLRVSNLFLTRTAIAVFGLGFIDAGYSGDWSRIGAISRETEELLKVAAYFVAPLCLFLIFAVTNREEG